MHAGVAEAAVQPAVGIRDPQGRGNWKMYILVRIGELPCSVASGSLAAAVIIKLPTSRVQEYFLEEAKSSQGWSPGETLEEILR